MPQLVAFDALRQDARSCKAREAALCPQVALGLYLQTLRVADIAGCELKWGAKALPYAFRPADRLGSASPPLQCAEVLRTAEQAASRQLSYFRKPPALFFDSLVATKSAAMLQSCPKSAALDRTDRNYHHMPSATPGIWYGMYSLYTLST